MPEQQFTPEELQSEEWRPVVGYESSHIVSSLGRVIRTALVRQKVPRLLGVHLNGRGYLHVALCVGGGQKTHRIASLVAAAFIGPRPMDFTINHRDGVKTNNRATNLEYVSQRANILHARDSLGAYRGARNSGAILTEVQVAEIRHRLGASRVNCCAIAREFGVQSSQIYRIRDGKSWSA